MGVAVFGALVLVNEPLEEHELPSRRVSVDQGIMESVAGLLTDAVMGQQNLEAPAVQVATILRVATWFGDL